jgi:Protein of unknown function (DUF3053)
MPLPSRRTAALGLIAALSLPLPGCGDNEEKQAAELQKFLQARILDRPGAGVPRPSEEEHKAFGRFAADYDVILTFNETMNASVNTRIGDVIRRGSFNRAQDFIDRKDDIATAREALKGMSTAMDGALRQANESKAALKQPDGLKPVYDKAFERMITHPAQIMRDVFPAADGVFAQGLEFSDFLTANKADFKFNGAVVETSKPNLLTEFNRRAQALAQTGNGLLEAQRKLQTMVRGQ